MAPSYVVPLREVSLAELGAVGGKNASFGELIRSLGAHGVRVPDGFAVTAAGFRLHLAKPAWTRPFTRSSTFSMSRTLRA